MNDQQWHDLADKPILALSLILIVCWIAGLTR